MHLSAQRSQQLLARSSGNCALQVTSILLLLITLLVPVHAADEFEEHVVKHYIIGGQPVARNTYPWMVALTYNDDAELVQRQFCGGSVIADNWVLTAAHCLYDRVGDEVTPDAFKVAINAANLNDANVPELDVANIYIHPEYQHNSTNPHSDIALIELANASGITPVTVSTKPVDSVVGLPATVMGWGAVDNSNPVAPLFPVRLHSVDVPIVSLQVCNAPESYAASIYPNQLCAGFAEGGRDSCVGDSGGPLVASYEGVVQQVGVVSFGFGCALPNFYGIYTHVAYFIDWINQYVHVGEREFEPELFEVKGTDTAIKNGGSSSSSGSGANSIIFIVIMFAGIIIRRRAC